jgi:hypothetical protein
MSVVLGVNGSYAEGLSAVDVGSSSVPADERRCRALVLSPDGNVQRSVNNKRVWAARCAAGSKPADTFCVEHRASLDLDYGRYKDAQLQHKYEEEIEGRTYIKQWYFYFSRDAVSDQLRPLWATRRALGRGGR